MALIGNAAYAALSKRKLLGLAAVALLPVRRSSAGAASFALKKIADGVFAFEGVHALMTPANEGAICNLGVVIGNEAVAVIDSGGSIIEARALTDAIKGVTDKPVRYLINTHMHPDHVFGNAHFRDAGAEIIGHRNLPEALAARKDTYINNFRRELGDELMHGVEIVPPTRLVQDKFTLNLGDRSLELRAWGPAHTDNDLTILDAKTSTLFTGDLAFIAHLPTLDGSLLGWMKQMDEIAMLPASRCVPGHGPAPSSWPQALDDERRYFAALASDIREAVAKGRKMGDVVKTAAASERERWQLFDEYNQRNAAAAFAELEWE
jgi:quinoprotein relay system zinc metallohydrolase 2